MEEEISLAELFAILKKRMTMIISVGFSDAYLSSWIHVFYCNAKVIVRLRKLLVNRKSESTEGIQLTDIIQCSNDQYIKDIIKGPVI